MMKVLRILYFAVIALFIVSGISACNTASNNETASDTSPSKASGLEVVEAEKVCMVNNMYMGGKDQIKIEADGKTYYGCCENCIKQIEENTKNVRFGKDPLTGEEVDKANAFIVKKQNDDLLYFASKDNYEKYLEQQVQ